MRGEREERKRRKEEEKGGKGGGEVKSLDKCKGEKWGGEKERKSQPIYVAHCRHCYSPCCFSPGTYSPVLQDWFHDRDGVVLQVVVDLHIPNTIILIGRLVNRLLEVGIKSQHLQEKRMLSVVVPDTNLILLNLHTRVKSLCGEPASAPAISLL